MSFMRRLWVESGINWVEALPRVLRVYHDTRGESGYSPFQIVFGRDRFVAGAPLPIERECVGASDFVDRMEWLDREVSKKLTDQLESEVSRANGARRVPPTYRPGDWVWVLRPKTGESSAKAETWWTGPVVVQKRTGDASYEVELHPGERHAVHADRLKPCVQSEPVDLFHFEAGYAQEGITFASGR
jgi:hypothetical protein